MTAFPADTVEVLIVEDNPNDLALVRRALLRSRLANRVQVARDGQEALDFLLGGGMDGVRPPKVILLDLKLPKLDGIEVLRRVKADPRTRAIPVVILTSSHEQRDIVDTYDLGVNSYIVKPVNFEEFEEAVRVLGSYWLVANQPPTVER